jgi:hypothetical protein
MVIFHAHRVKFSRALDVSGPKSLKNRLALAMLVIQLAT